MPGEKLPSKRKLADQLGISIKTVMNAYDQLLLEGYVHSYEKKGYFVSDLENYRLDTKHSVAHFETNFKETIYKVNLRANKNSLDDFPANTWCRLMRETLLESKHKLFDTVPFSGVTELREEIASHLRSFRGMDVSPDRIIVGAGTEYMYNRLIQLLGIDYRYALTDPSSKRLREIYTINHLKYNLIPSGFDGPDLELLEESDCNIIHVAPAHQYPLGCVLPVDRRIALLEWVNKKPNRYIIEDDFDSEYVISGKPISPVYSIDIMDKVIYMNTFSKSVSPAMRICYMILPESLIPRYFDTMSFYSCTVASVEQYTLAKFIKEGNLERYIHKINRKNQQIKKHLLEKLKPLFDEKKAEIISGNAGTHILLKLNISKSDEEIKKELLDKSIKTSMLSEYYGRGSIFRQGVIVLNYSGLSEEQINYLVDAIKGIF